MILDKILRRNTSPGRIVGFVISNFIGLAIILGAIQFYGDARSIWDSKDSFIKTDYLVINKRVTAGNTLGSADSRFTESEIADLESQPWVRSVGRFRSSDFNVRASMQQGDRGMSTAMFFEAIPDEYIDVPRSQWMWRPGADEVPIIISKDYLALYNFGFATSSGLPQLSEGLMSSIPLTLTLISEDGTRMKRMYGRVAGFSNRLNTILVPLEFLEEANRTLGSGTPAASSRLIVDVSSPGDVAINKYLEEHSLEVGGDKSASSAAFLLKLVVGLVIGVGALITLLSLFILILSVSLIMEKNRDKLHQLLMLGYPLRDVSRPYRRLVMVASVAAYLLALCAVFCLRAYYLEPLSALGAEPGGCLLMPLIGAGLTALIIACNLVAVSRRVRASFRN